MSERTNGQAAINIGTVVQLERAVALDRGVELKKFSPTTAVIDLPSEARAVIGNPRGQVGDADLWAAKVSNNARVYATDPETALRKAIRSQER